MSSSIAESSTAQLQNRIQENLKKTKGATAIVEGIIQKFNESNKAFSEQVVGIGWTLNTVHSMVKTLKAQKEELPQDLEDLLNNEQAAVGKLIAAVEDTKGVVTTKLMEESAEILKKANALLLEVAPTTPTTPPGAGGAAGEEEEGGGGRARKGGYIIAAHKKKSHTRKSRSTLPSSRRSKTRKRERKRKGGKK